MVDDNDTNRLIYEEILSNWGMKPTCASSGEAALTLMRRAAAISKPFRLALLDAMMPGMDGFTLAKSIKQAAELADCPLLMLSSGGEHTDLARAQDAGIARCLTKPVKQSDLLEAIAWALREDKELNAKPSPIQHAAHANQRPLRVLLTEDGLVNQQVAVGLLELAGHHVVVAGNGHEALAALENQPFDVVLMHVQMPEMDGLEATAAIRAREKTTGKHIPIIAMTAHAMKGDREMCMTAGMDGYLSKPILAESLYEALDALVPQETAKMPQATAATEAAACTVLPPLDWPTALERVRGRQEFLVKMIDLFLTECERLIPEIRGAIDRTDATVLRRAAHTLKGSADCFAARPVVEAAQRLESMGHDNKWDGVEEAWTALLHEIAVLMPALEARRNDI